MACKKKTNHLANTAETIGPKTNNAKTNATKINAESENPITLGGQNIEEVQNFVYLGSKITEDEDSMTDFLVRISMATRAYAALQNILDRHKLQNHDL